ncbi:MAG: DUF1893 domain-containing protein [Oscillospiraceae bacterium]|nr:DUF1893 domain-containing protein [Oscillospiraceae bacterium]
MSDIERAKQLLHSGGYTCVLCKGDAVYTSTERGVAPMVEWLDNGAELHGFAAADKVIGKAAAMLFVLAGVSEIYSDVMSASAAEFLKNSGVRYSYDALTQHIINRKGDGICPMEQLTADMDSAEEAFVAIKEKLTELRKGKL